MSRDREKHFFSLSLRLSRNSILLALFLLAATLVLLDQNAQNAANKMIQESKEYLRPQKFKLFIPPYFNYINATAIAPSSTTTTTTSTTTRPTSKGDGSGPRIWASMGLCFGKTTKMYGKGKYPYEIVTPLAVILWKMFTDADVLIQIIYHPGEWSSGVIIQGSKLDSNH